MTNHIHTCSVCGMTDHWSDDWYWFGSIDDFENGRPILKTCSTECREKLGKGQAELVFEGVGKIESRTSYFLSCGMCGESRDLEADSKRAVVTEAEQAGWVKHSVGGWLCPKCGPQVQLAESATGTRADAAAVDEAGEE